jgi:hypothetical protein
VRRSDYIYVALLEVYGVRTPKAAFTVKYEMVRWLKQQEHPYFYLIWRIRDNDVDASIGIAPVKLSVEELLK